MMGPLATRIRKQMEDLGSDVRAIAAEIFNEQKQRSGAKESREPAAIADMLQKVLDGADDGIEFFFGDDSRLASFSEVLEVDQESLKKLRNAQKQFRTLVLDPRLPLAPRRYLKRRQIRNADKFDVIEPHGRRLEDLKNAAQDSLQPLVVLSDDGGDDEEDYFAEAGIEATRVYWHRRGYLLESTPELVPEPPAPPPRLFDDDGWPMIPLEELEQEIIHGPDSAEKERVKAIIEQGGIPTFRVEAALEYLTRARGRESMRWLEAIPTEEEENLFIHWMDRHDETTVWCHDGQLFYIGADDEEVLGEIRESHPVVIPACFGNALNQLNALNPFLCIDKEGKPQFTGRWEQVRQEVLDECGVDIVPVFVTWCKQVEERVRPRYSISQRAPALEAKARAAIESLILRPVSISIDEAEYVFALRAMAQAPLVVVPPEPFDVFHVVANLGSGKLLWVRAITFPNEQPRPLRRYAMPSQWPGYEDAVSFDGGDVHLWMRLMTSEWLLGTPLS